MRGLRGKARKCPIETVSVCLKKNGVGKLIVYDSDVESGEVKQFWRFIGNKFFCNASLRLVPGQSPSSNLNK